LTSLPFVREVPLPLEPMNLEAAGRDDSGPVWVLHVSISQVFVRLRCAIIPLCTGGNFCDAYLQLERDWRPLLSAER
jgi:hypothetical protein